MAEITLNAGEKLILLMLADISKHLKVDGDIDPDFVSETIATGQLWGLSWKYSSLNVEQDEPAVVSETCEILNMYRFIDASYNSLPEPEQKRIEKEAYPFSSYITFRGFDGNEDHHYGILQYLVDTLGRYEERKSGERNSHASVLPQYRRMLSKFEVYERERSGMAPFKLSADELIALLKQD